MKSSLRSLLFNLSCFTFLSTLLAFSVSSTTTSLRQPANAQETFLLDQMEKWNKLSLNNQNCSQALSGIQKTLSDFQAQQGELRFSEIQWKAYVSQVQQFHLNTVRLQSNECTLKLRSIYTQLRAYQDWTAEPIFEKSIPFAVGAQAAPIDIHHFAFRTGDVLLTRGNTFLSSTISQISTNQHHYSHVAYVYVDPTTGQAYTLESYPTKGAQIYPMEKALKNDNVRILLLRPKEAQKAQTAVTYMYTKITNAINAKKPINYDYRYDEKDLTRLSCVEVVQEAYEQTLHEKIPSLKSEVVNRNQTFLSSIGIQQGQFFVPGDLETDPRFDLIFEWTDYRATADQRIKDAIVKKMFQWISEENYYFQGTLKSLASNLILSFRHKPAAWNLISNQLGMHNVPMEVPGEILTVMVKMNDVGSVVMPIVQEADQKSLKERGRHLTETEIGIALENFRAEDRQAFLNRKPAPLHFLFRPRTMQAPVPDIQ